MRILIANTQVPFVHGGAEFLATSLAGTLREHGHHVEHINVPFKWYPPERILDHILACRLLDITESCGEVIDHVIGLKFPAYYVKHPSKSLWVLHQYRQAYDLWGTEYGDSSFEQSTIRAAIVQADNNFIPEARKILSLSQTVASRLKRFNNVDAPPLYPPPPEHDRYYAEEPGDFILMPSRLNGMKRQHLAIEAMRFVKSSIKLVIAGAPDTKSYQNELKAMIRKYELQERVKLLGRISVEEKLNLYARALAVLFIPYDEDYGFITLEAGYARKPLITCRDSGGPLEFIGDQETGLVCEPDPKAIADAIETLAGDRMKARKFGQQALELIKTMNLSLDRVAEELTK